MSNILVVVHIVDCSFKSILNRAFPPFYFLPQHLNRWFIITNFKLPCLISDSFTFNKAGVCVCVCLYVCMFRIWSSTDDRWPFLKDEKKKHLKFITLSFIDQRKIIIIDNYNGWIFKIKNKNINWKFIIATSNRMKERKKNH